MYIQIQTSYKNDTRKNDDSQHDPFKTNLKKKKVKWFNFLRDNKIDSHKISCLSKQFFIFFIQTKKCRPSVKQNVYQFKGGKINPETNAIYK